MIPTLGVMIGCYILVRMFSFILRSGSIRESIFVRILSALNIFVTLFLMIDLVLSGVKK